MGDKKTLITSIINRLKDKPCSISEIAKDLMNWKTAEQNLELLETIGIVFNKNIKNTRTYFLREDGNYYKLPIKKEHEEIITAIYAKIKEFCLNKFNKEPTKTQVYKTIWTVNKELNLNLPIGWYLYGPCCVQVYNNDEKPTIKLATKYTSVIKKVTEDYCQYDNLTLQRKIYREEDNNLYKTKESIVSHHFSNKDELNVIMMNFIKFAPQEAIDLVTDYVRATLLLGKENTMECFEYVWKYISAIKFKESLEFYYRENSQIYFEDKISELRNEAQIYITDLVRSHTQSKQIQEKQS